MEIKEIEQQKKELELSIFEALNQRFEKFKRETGVCPDSIYVHMRDIYFIGRKKPETVIEGVSVNIKI